MGSAWRITYDPTMLSAKRRKASGIYDPLENQDTLNSSDDESEPEKNLSERFEESLTSACRRLHRG